MAQLSFHENGIHFGAVRVATGQDVTQKVKKYPRWLFMVVNLILVLLAAVAILFSLYFSDLFTLYGIGGEKQELRYTLELYDASGSLDVTALEGATVTDAESGTVIGTVQATSRQAKSIILPDFTTGKASIEETNAQIVTLTVVVTANYMQNDGYYVDNIRLAMNQNYCITVGEYTGQGNCVTLTAITGEER